MNINGTKGKVFTFTMYYCVTQACGVRFLPSIHQYRFFKSVELHWLTFYMDLFHSGTSNVLCRWIPRDFSRFPCKSPETWSLRLILKFHVSIDRYQNTGLHRQSEFGLKNPMIIHIIKNYRDFHLQTLYRSVLPTTYFCMTKHGVSERKKCSNSYN